MEKIYDTVHSPDIKKVKEWLQLRVINVWSSKNPIAYSGSTSVPIELLHCTSTYGETYVTKRIENLEDWKKEEIVKMGYRLA